MNRPSAPAAAATDRPVPPPLVEPLEGRRLLAFTASVSGSAATLIGSASADQLSLTVLNGLFRHNRFTAGDAGFASNADFDTATPGVQVLSATGTTLSVNTGDGNDVVTVGRSFDPITATVNLNLGAGSADTAYLLDDATTAGQTYKFVLGPNANLLGGSIDAGGGSDTLRYPSRTSAVTVNLATGTATGARTIRGIETVVGGAGNDVLTGGAGADSLFGGGGNDLITGNGGSDTLLGSAGNDTIIGSAGDDLLNGQAGHDSLVGGDGNDLMYGGHDKDTLKGNAGHDRLYGEIGDDLLDGGIGNDSLAGSSGADFLIGGDGTDNADNDPRDRRSGIELFV